MNAKVGDNPQRLMTIAEVGEGLGVSTTYLYSLIEDGWIRPEEIFARQTRKTTRRLIRKECFDRLRKRQRDRLPLCGE